MVTFPRALSRALFPRVESLLGRPTQVLIDFLEQSQWWEEARMHAYRQGLWTRLMTHSITHCPHYRDWAQTHGLNARDLRDMADLAKFPILERVTAQRSFAARMSEIGPPVVVTKSSSGTTGEPMKVAYNAESRHFRDAMRWRAYGWAGYRPGHCAVHYWGQLTTKLSAKQRMKIWADRAWRRDIYIDCTPRSDEALAQVAKRLHDLEPDVVVAYAQGVAALARYMNRAGHRLHKPTPVICGAEKLLAHDRIEITNAFGVAPFDTYGCRETMLIGAEDDGHDGHLLAMENLIVEVVMREGDIVRNAAPHELGDILLTDLHNLANPMIRYANGDKAFGIVTTPSRSGRTLHRLGAIEGRVVDELQNAQGQAVGGLSFSVLFVELTKYTQKFSVTQKKDLSLDIRMVLLEELRSGDAVDAAKQSIAASIGRFTGSYFPGLPVQIVYVDEIPPTPAGKHRFIVKER